MRSEEARDAFFEATARILAYWADECARDLEKLMTHFTRDAEVITPDIQPARSPLCQRGADFCGYGCA